MSEANEVYDGGVVRGLAGHTDGGGSALQTPQARSQKVEGKLTLPFEMMPIIVREQTLLGKSDGHYTGDAFNDLNCD